MSSSLAGHVFWKQAAPGDLMVHPFRQEFPEFEGDFMSPDIDEKVGLLFTSKLPGYPGIGTANSKAIRAERPEDMCLAIARAKAGL